MSKFENLSTTSNFQIGGGFQQKAGAIKYGTDQDDNYPNTNTRGVFSVGSAYTQGNRIRSFYDLTDLGPFRYNYLEADAPTPQFEDFPFKFPTQDWPDTQEITTLSIKYPIFRMSGKGMGKVEFWNAGTSSEGNQYSAYPVYMQHYKSIRVMGDLPPQPQQKNVDGEVYPYSGLLYAGNLVQFKFETGSVSTKPKVIPYQAARGIPQYDPTKEYYSGNPFGNPLWSDGVAIEPFLSPGASPGNNEFCVGATLDTYGQNNPKIYNYKTPTGYTTQQLDKLRCQPWYQHPAPFTAPSVNTSFNQTPKILSPGPNLSGGYWAPWPSFYAYNPGDSVPVITRGVTTLNIGAAYNIGMQVYYEPDVVDGDDPQGNPLYLPVQCIPLFQGEIVNVGDYVYATAMGHIITHDRRGVSPYPPGTFCNTTGNFRISPQSGSIVYGFIRDAREENPWWDWYDPTFGATGWTSTPGFILSGIPDGGVSINGTDALPYVVQSLQGSSIVQARTITDPLSEGGSGRMNLIGSAEYRPQSTENLINFEKMSKFPGQVDRGLAVGSIMQDIEGTGSWGYTGHYNIPEQVLVNGFGFFISDFPIKGGSGEGAIVSVTSVDANGSITGLVLSSAGTGYVEGELVEINPVNGSYPFAESSVHIPIPVSFIYSLSGLVINTAGTGYRSDFNVQGYNLTRNNLIVSLTVEFGTNNPPNYITSSVITYGFTNTYPQSTQFYIMNELSSQKYTKDGPLAIYEVSTIVPTTTISVLENFRGDGSAYPTGTYLYSTMRLDNDPLVLTIKATDAGLVEEIHITDIGTNNFKGDIILVNQPGSSKNCTFELDLTPEGDYSLKLIKGGSGYVFNEDTYVRWKSIYNQLSTKNPGGTSADLEMYLGNTTTSGTINKVTYNRYYRTIGMTSTTIGNPFPDFGLYNASFGTRVTLLQTPTITAAQQPTVGTIPIDGWTNYQNINNACFYQNGYVFISSGGTGYIANTTYSVTGGTGTLMTVRVYKVDSTGAVLDAKIQNIGSGYKVNDKILLNGGDCIMFLKVPLTETVLYSLLVSGPVEYSSPQYVYEISYMLFDYKFLQHGTGYTVGTGYTLIIPNRSATLTSNVSVDILAIDLDGGILDIRFVGDTEGLQLSNSVKIEGGNDDCYILIEPPVPLIDVQFEKGGTGYTTQTNVTTYNIQANNLFTIVSLEFTGPGELGVIDYSNIDIKPYGWNLKRYNVGDVLQFDQGGNVSATAEILTIDLGTFEITFNQLTVGAGYIKPATSFYGFVPTINTSLTPTTVDIIADSNGNITHVTLNTLGTGVEVGDYCVIQQPGSDFNSVFRILPQRDVPPQWQLSENGRDPTAADWNELKTQLKTSKNLLGEQIAVDMYPNHPNYMNPSWYNYGDGGQEYDQMSVFF